MEFGPSDEQRLFTDSLGRFLAEQSPLQRVREIGQSKTGFDATLWKGLADLGVAGIMTSERHGGSGLSLFDAALAMGFLGKAATPAPFLSTSVLAPIALQACASEKQQQLLLPAIARGELVVGAGLTEVAHRRIEPVEVADGKLNGSVRFVMDGGAANYFILALDNHNLVLVDANASGITLTPMQTVDRTRALLEIELNNTPFEWIGEPDAGGYTIRLMLSAARVLLAADSLGAGDEMIRQSVEYAKQRVQFDRIIASFQAVKHLCAEMVAELEPCRSLVWYAAYAYDSLPEEAELLACHAKAQLGDVGRFVARTATEVHGGMGFTDLLGLHYWFKRIMLDRQLLGDPQATRLEAARLQDWAL